MDYPNVCTFPVNNVFGPNNITITLYTGLTILLGANAAGKTQTLKEFRNYLRKKNPPNKVRYLASNRIGDMEWCRSRANTNSVDPNRYI